jgi:hypothetical protein
MTQLLELETRLSLVAHNPCSCTFCRQSAKYAKMELAEVSPLNLKLLGTPEFDAAVKQFNKAETIRLQKALDFIIASGRCLLTPPPAPVTLTPIPDLPAPEEWRERVEHYRKHAMKPRLRKDSAEPIEHPRIPGSFVFK